jgi:hypothetical protein
LSKEAVSREKGLALELKLYNLYKSKGYDVIHNVKKRGRSGAEHQIDVFAEYRCPLHTSQVIIEAKAYDSPINKDRIMKLIQIVDDLGVDRGIIITTSYFTPDAIKTAVGHNVTLWDRNHLVNLLGELEIIAVKRGLSEQVKITESIVKPHLSIIDARRIVIDRLNKAAGGGFLGIGKIVERLENIWMVYYPYYEAEIQAHITEEMRTGLLSKKRVAKRVSSKVSVDAITGELATINENGISYRYGYLSKLDQEEMKVIKFSRRFTARSLTRLGFSEYKARKIANQLVSKGVAKSSKPSRGPTVYSLSNPFPSDPRKLKSISSTVPTQENIKLDQNFISPKINASVIIASLESYWNGVKVQKISTIYYPKYPYTLVAEDGSKRVEYLDAITGSIQVAIL